MFGGSKLLTGGRSRLAQCKDAGAIDQPLSGKRDKGGICLVVAGFKPRPASGLHSARIATRKPVIGRGRDMVGGGSVLQR